MVALTALPQSRAPVLPASARNGMTNVGRLLLPDPIGAQYNAAIDPTTGFGYFGESGARKGGVLSKVNLNGQLPTLVDDGQPNSVPKDVVALLAIEMDTSDPDPLKHFLYIGTASGQILKMSPGDARHTPRLLSVLHPTSAKGSILCGVIDTSSRNPAQHYAYYGIRSEPPKVLRIRLSDFSDQGAETLNMASVRYAGIDTVRHYAYFTNFGNQAHRREPPQIAKVNLANFRDGSSSVATYTMDSTKAGDGIARDGFDYPSFDEGLIIDQVHNYGYIGTYNASPGKLDVWPNNQSRVVRVRLGMGDSFPQHPLEVLNLRLGERDLAAGVLDSAHGNIYFGTDNTYPAHVYMIHVGDGTTPMKEGGRLDLNTGSLSTWPHDGETVPGAKAALFGEIYLRSAILDTAHDAIYFGTDSRPGQVIKIGINGRWHAP